MGIETKYLKENNLIEGRIIAETFHRQNIAKDIWESSSDWPKNLV